MEKIYKDKNFLQEQYCVLNRSAKSIASDFSVNKTSILRALKKHGIKIKTHDDYMALNKKPYMDKAWIKTEYINKGKTTTEIAREQHVSASIILKWLNRAGIEARDRHNRMKGERHHSFRGGKYVALGYVYSYCPDHPRRNSLKDKRPYIKEHILVMEKSLGRYLKAGEEVHHKDGNKLNNKPDNLQLFESSSKHIKYEMMLRDFAKKILFSDLPISNREELLELFNNFQCS